MSTHVIERVGSPVARLLLRAKHVMWLGAGLVFGFLVSFVFADVLELPRDLASVAPVRARARLD